MARRLFGTDGIRGRANSWPMTAAQALAIGTATGRHFIRGDHLHRVLIGKDVRRSGYMIESALTAGFLAAGMDVYLVGPLPTPAIAMLTRSLRADLGVMISASHNPHYDNGIKLFGPDGYKLSDEVELAIESRVAEASDDDLASPERLGRARRIDDAQGRYIEFVKATVPKGLTFDGLRIVIDCAHGAAYRVAPTVLAELGAEVIPLGVAPDGLNINRDCGSTHPEAMQAEVLRTRADIGLALDGDADRLIVCDERGQIVDGDQIMAVIAERMAQAGTLKGGGIVATVMSNLGLERHLAGLGLSLARTKVGDRYVVEHMRAHGFNLGGEQSGHLVLSDASTTGDGLLAGLQVVSALVEGGKPASELCRRFTALPQVLKNAKAPTAVLNLEPIRTRIGEAEAVLGRSGRLLIRPSGTEPVIRVMAEGEDEAQVRTIVSDLVGELERAGIGA
ncbi:phosphoglucosamine mutase [Zavarzinia sp. CC-PAN008]|uniref:phosphoglucosamine mutase n=1 Tax=Zavarzinia sp. CC-PAN008 TaxID=3243332 RepID=UPI003F748802